MLDTHVSWQPGDIEELLPAGLRSARLTRVAVFREPAEAFAIWDRLEAVAAVSPYQTRAWMMPWLETTGRTTGVKPLIIVAFDEADQPLALLPFGLWRQGVLRVAGFLGGRDSNFNIGLFRPGFAWNAASLLKLFRLAANGHDGIDLFVLCNQPHQWEGVSNPLLALPHQPSPSFGYKATLFRDPDAFLTQNLSRENRKKLRKKAARLATLGPVKHRVAKDAASGRAILDAFVEQRLTRCAALGIGASDLPDMRVFLERTSIVEMAHPPVELHALWCGDRIVATFGGTKYRNRFCGMVMSFDADPEFARSSPGEILLEGIIRSKCVEGVAIFDLGIGEARYKEAYCPDVEPLFDSVVAVSRRGRVFSIAERIRLRVKRELKQSEWAWKAIRAARKLIRGLRRFPGAVR